MKSDELSVLIILKTEEWLLKKAVFIKKEINQGTREIWFRRFGKKDKFEYERYLEKELGTYVPTNTKGDPPIKQLL